MGFAALASCAENGTRLGAESLETLEKCAIEGSSIEREMAIGELWRMRSDIRERLLANLMHSEEEIFSLSRSLLLLKADDMEWYKESSLCGVDLQRISWDCWMSGGGCALGIEEAEIGRELDQLISHARVTSLESREGGDYVLSDGSKQLGLVQFCQHLAQNERMRWAEWFRKLSGKGWDAISTARAVCMALDTDVQFVTNGLRITRQECCFRRLWNADHRRILRNGLDEECVTVLAALCSLDRAKWGFCIK